jgi:hypothetical protein
VGIKAGDVLLKGLRFLFLIAIISCLAMPAARAQWESRLIVGNCAFIIDLERAPLWSPPEAPAYSEFRVKFADLPPSGPRGSVLLKWDWTLLDLLLHVWAVTVLFSAAYIALRSQRRDVVFHSVLGTAIGMTCGAALCMGLWLLFGGWAPPAPELFGLAGLVAGLFLALLDWAVGKVS